MHQSSPQFCSDIPFFEGDYPIKEDRVISVFPDGEILLKPNEGTLAFQAFTVRISAENPKVTRQFIRSFSLPRQRAHLINYRELYEAAEATQAISAFTSGWTVEAIAVILAVHDVLIRKGYAISVVKRKKKPHLALFKNDRVVVLRPLSLIELAWLACV